MAVLLLAAGSAAAEPPTTLDETVEGDPAATFSPLRSGPGWPRVLRSELAPAGAGREARRRSLAAFVALDELHYVDEESPARVEFLDADSTPFTSAWFPDEALRAFEIDRMFRTLRALPRSPVPQARGKRARFALAVVTGDGIDNQQRNESAALLGLLEGGTVDPNSGVASSTACPAGPVDPAEAPRYTGVQDYDDYPENEAFYDPDQPAGRYAAWPRWPGLMDRAQQPFAAAGLPYPSYVSLGNHDRLAQGNQYANAGFESVATGCVKAFAPPAFGAGLASALTSTPQNGVAVPRDPGRGSLSYPELRKLYGSGRQADAHGFAYVDPAEAAASAGAASYYSFSPRPGVRLISINTVSEGGIAGPSAEGNLDDPQFQWLRRELERARGAGEVAVVFGHHPIASLNSTVPDEAAPACGSGPDRDPNAGCDLDPRDSRPIHGGKDVAALLTASPAVVAYVAGHTTKNRILPFKREGGGGFWQIESGAASQWPSQARLLDLMDNRDGTLSLFATMISQGGPVSVPPPGPAAGFDGDTLASIGRTLSFNDFQNDPVAKVGAPEGRNVELLLPDPRPAQARTAGGCRPRRAAVARFTGRRPRRARRAIKLRGVVTRTACARRVARVQVSVNRRGRGRRCRAVGKRGRLRPSRPCARRTWLPARGKARWTRRFPRGLPRGRYVARARAVDRAGHRQRRPAVRRFRLRPRTGR